MWREAKRPGSIRPLSAQAAAGLPFPGPAGRVFGSIGKNGDVSYRFPRAGLLPPLAACLTTQQASKPFHAPQLPGPLRRSFGRVGRRPSLGFSTTILLG